MAFLIGCAAAYRSLSMGRLAWDPGQALLPCLRVLVRAMRATGKGWRLTQFT